ncbi:class I SAM-dependent methyltransferase [Herbiconiux sp. P16]|uniref:class I SAM-dependent methyltransferase n=1 Tax=Herbiconiux wuyangfengii TaxID=3342794 RepID=UPI0035B7157F
MNDVFDYDAELIRYNRWLREAADVGIGDRVLDIGCGAGQSTREAARAASSGSATGVDISASMIDRARRLTDDEGLRNVTFERADAQTHPFATEDFTVGISRFGTMFFADPAAAFGNIGSALRPGARLVQLAWQAPERQEWVEAIRHALAGGGEMPAGPGGGAFSLADPALADGLLTTAGFTAVEIVDVREPVFYGPSAAGARDALVGLGMVDRLLAGLDAAERARAHDRLLTLLESHDTGDGVWFDSRVWLITARWGCC